MENDKKICPFCGEEIKKDAIKCKYCKEWLDKEKMPQDSQISALKMIEQKGNVWKLLAIIIGCFIFAFAYWGITYYIEEQANSNQQNAEISAEETANNQEVLEETPEIQNGDDVIDEPQAKYTQDCFPTTLHNRGVSEKCFEKANFGDNSSCTNDEIEKIENYYKNKESETDPLQGGYEYCFDEVKIRDKVCQETGVSKECYDAWQYREIEGEYKGKTPCPDEDFDKIDKYCEGKKYEECHVF